VEDEKISECPQRPIQRLDCETIKRGCYGTADHIIISVYILVYYVWEHVVSRTGCSQLYENVNKTVPPTYCLVVHGVHPAPAYANYGTAFMDEEARAKLAWRMALLAATRAVQTVQLQHPLFVRCAAAKVSLTQENSAP
jgi:hypothetical protein